MSELGAALGAICLLFFPSEDLCRVAYCWPHALDDTPSNTFRVLVSLRSYSMVDSFPMILTGFRDTKGPSKIQE